MRQTGDELQGVVLPENRPRNAANPVQEVIVHLQESSLPPQWGHFQQAGHCMFDLVLGAFGGLVARYFYGGRGRNLLSS